MPVCDRVAELTTSVSHSLETLTVVVRAEVTLDERVKFSREVDGALFLVAEEHLLEREPDEACGTVRLHDSLQEVGGDGPIEPREHDAIHPSPGRVMRKSVVGEGIFPKRDEEEPTPLLVIRGAEVKDDGDKRLDIENRHRLGMKSVDGVRGWRSAPECGAGGLFMLRWLKAECSEQASEVGR